MPRRDGTGPVGMGSMTGRGMGFCNLAKAAGTIGGLGLGLGLARRFGRGLGFCNYSNAVNPSNQKDLLINQKAILEEQLNQINSQLNTSEDVK